VADLKPIYLVCGDDDVKIDAWRSKLRARAEQEGGLEAHEAPAMTPDALAAELAALTFSTGTRWIQVDNVESWKAPVLEPVERALGAMPPETVLLMVARGKAQPRLCKAVEAGGGEVRAYEAPSQKQLWKWVIERAADQGLKLDADAARTLVALTGTRQQRLAREVERLALVAYPEGQLDAVQVGELAAGETSPQVYELADAVVAGDSRTALAAAERLREQGEAPSRLLYAVVRRLRDVHRAAELLDAGVGESEAASKIGGHPYAAKLMVAAAKKAGRHSLEDAICIFAQLEIDFRGGGLRADYALDEETALSVAIARASGGMQARAAA
jgi:DNA polymerase-3 subunit delta